jgi:hypothetical protein
MAKRKAHFVNAFGDKHNSLFSPGPNSRLNACVGRNGGPAGFDRYAYGYFEAGSRLVKSLQADPFHVDSVIYPLVMVYRHGVETALKHLARILPPLCDETENVKLTHKLMDNWNIVRRYLEQLEFEIEDLDRVGAILADLVEIDFNGEPFRYPESKDGKRYLQDTSHINVEILAEGMDYVGKYFEYACFGVDGLREALYEQRQENARAEQEFLDSFGRE